MSIMMPHVTAGAGRYLSGRDDRARMSLLMGRPFLLALTAGIAAWVVYVGASRPWFSVGDQSWVLDVARHVAAGDGVKTSITFPAYLAASQGSPIDQNPWFIYPPGYPLLLGGVAKILGASETSALLLHGVFFVALLALTYLLARRFLDPVASALVVLLLGLQPNLLQQSAMSYSSDLPFAVALLAATVAVVRAPAARPTVALAAGGALLALAQMFRFNAATLIPSFGALVALQYGWWRPSVRPVAAFVVAWTVVVIVLLWLSQAGATTSTFSSNLLLIDTPGSPGLSIEGDPNMPPVDVVLRERLGAILGKAVAGARFYVGEFTSVGHPVATGGVLLAGLLLLVVRPARPVVVFAALATVTTAGLVSFIAFDVRYLLFLMPSYLLLVVWALRSSAPDLRVAGSVLIALTLFVYAGETARLARDEPARAVFASDFRALAAIVRETTRPGDWTASDVHHMVAWHAGVPTLRLPNRVEELADVARLRQPVTRIVLTNVGITPARRNYPDERWERALNGAALEGFVLERSFEGEVLRAVVLRSK